MTKKKTAKFQSFDINFAREKSFLLNDALIADIIRESNVNIAKNLPEMHLHLMQFKTLESSIIVSIVNSKQCPWLPFLCHEF